MNFPDVVCNLGPEIRCDITRHWLTSTENARLQQPRTFLTYQSSLEDGLKPSAISQGGLNGSKLTYMARGSAPVVPGIRVYYESAVLMPCSRPIKVKSSGQAGRHSHGANNPPPPHHHHRRCSHPVTCGFNLRARGEALTVTQLAEASPSMHPANALEERLLMHHRPGEGGKTLSGVV